MRKLSWPTYSVATKREKYAACMHGICMLYCFALLQIYTYIGEVLVSVNPYKNFDIYNDEYVEEYRGRELQERPPHIFALADAAYYDMKRLLADSCIVITGTMSAIQIVRR